MSAPHRKNAPTRVPGRDSRARVGELTALTWDDVDLAAGTIAIRRTVSWAKPQGLQGLHGERFRYKGRVRAGVDELVDGCRHSDRRAEEHQDRYLHRGPAAQAHGSAYINRDLEGWGRGPAG